VACIRASVIEKHLLILGIGILSACSDGSGGGSDSATESTSMPTKGPVVRPGTTPSSTQALGYEFVEDDEQSWPLSPWLMAERDVRMNVKREGGIIWSSHVCVGPTESRRLLRRVHADGSETKDRCWIALGWITPNDTGAGKRYEWRARIEYNNGEHLVRSRVTGVYDFMK
jgi:hypothetical protein